MKVTKGDREKAMAGGNVPVLYSEDYALTAFLQPNMKIVIRTQIEYENARFSQEMTQEKAQAIINDYNDNL